MKLNVDAIESYKSKLYQEAADLFDKAVNLKPSEFSLLSNRAACYLQLGQYSKCIEDCRKVIEMLKTNHKGQPHYISSLSKSLARRGSAYCYQGNLLNTFSIKIEINM